ncbi:MAG: M20/M25/M40 family metallo-hydrolase [Fimbriimonadaceae bacterium]|nr:M20/M25/M40 family metallo-hydrolase [Fimbriimonadaceae bacterium]
MDWVEDLLRESGAEVTRLGDNVIAKAGSGPKILLNTHLDTVPPNDGWTRDPWNVETIDGKVYGLGSNDAKASAAAMIATLLGVQKAGGPCEVVLMLVCEEETGGKGTEIAWPWLQQQGWEPDGVVVGEPTELQIGIAQRGLMILELVHQGTACHAANANSLGAVNPVWGLAEDIVKLRQIDLGEPHPQLGVSSLQPTVLKGAATHNQVPAEASAKLDFRTVPGLTHSELLERLEECVAGEIRIHSSRLEPYQCPVDAIIVQSALRIGTGTKTFASLTMSDQVFFQGVPAIKCGPGISARSHTADEFVLASEIEQGFEFYRALLKEVAHATALG